MYTNTAHVEIFSIGEDWEGYYWQSLTFSDGYIIDGEVSAVLAYLRRWEPKADRIVIQRYHPGGQLDISAALVTDVH